MTGLIYGLKSMRRDKMCVLSFLLPIIAGAAILLMGDMEFSAAWETAFGAVEKELSAETVRWLEQYGALTLYPDEDQLRDAVNDPATPVIGVRRSGEGIRTVLSGDELQLYREIAATLPLLYERRGEAGAAEVEVFSAGGGGDELRALLIAITLVTAMFMGCTYNAMSIIGEKEDGITNIHHISPMTRRQYATEKIALGFIGGALSAGITAAICLRVEAAYLLPTLALLVLSAYISALAGLFIGRISGGLMVGMMYSKLAMLLLICPPVLFYLLLPPGSVALAATCLLPSSATFYGLMDLLNGDASRLGAYLAVLLAHGVVWSLVYAGRWWRRERQI